MAAVPRGRRSHGHTPWKRTQAGKAGGLPSTPGVTTVGFAACGSAQEACGLSSSWPGPQRLNPNLCHLPSLCMHTRVRVRAPPREVSARFYGVSRASPPTKVKRPVLRGETARNRPVREQPEGRGERAAAPPAV